MTDSTRIVQPDDTVLVAELMGPGEIRELAGVSRQTFSEWKSRPDFPAPLRTLGIGEVWDGVLVRAWLKARGR